MTTLSGDNLSACLARIIDDLAEHGWSLQPLFTPSTLTLDLAEECHRRAAAGALVPASVGRGTLVVVSEGVRGDRIQWLEAGQDEASDQYMAIMEGLRQALNQGLYLGLEDFESHFALYPPGAFYLKHLDRFRDNDRRTVSAVLYLNQDWQVEEGGALRLYLPNGEIRDVLPQAGSLLVFLSADMPHEVLPATRDRLSLTGWFRRRGDGPL
ncbi:MAG: 2OG-Fe(II) oxygenase [Gammaproteobacteria bacterium]|uniref:2OG-Fe(II) oxygenase n=1 Tax=Pseudomonas sp. TaxID=306 RepID=UPI003981B780|nr:2OG-Fe(II) oxygenase [Gammaproteobacteria bacterium]MBU1489687.1 2OG-Fe(II) oxygenase [Gammaproteobacteria bacterium]MBU2064976.1 2OG-Fe(II) oxygenase [Gammaproteobacteria bacterium]MBU2138906.1 2OG-Fe(II) oxygenase [Gammaproteobacteria bacterium]MBU2256371.1 2OG-Fe(II) oxygenase [Gammaproteobacteria bacterium]